MRDRASSGINTKPMPRTTSPDERLPGIGGQVVGRAADCARFGQERRDARDGLVIENKRRLPLSPTQPDVSHFEARRTRPRSAGDRSGDNATISHQLVEPDLSGVALGDRVRRQEAKLTTVPHQGGGPQSKVRTQVGTAPLPPSEVLNQIIPVRRPHVSGDLLPAHERWVADKRIEPCPVDEDLGELQGPVEPTGDPRLSQSLLRFLFQLLGWQDP